MERSVAWSPEAFEDVETLDVSEARRPNQEMKRVNVDFPRWMIAALDKEARRLEPRDVSTNLSAETAQTEEQLQMHVVLLEVVPLIHRHRLERVSYRPDP